MPASGKANVSPASADTTSSAAAPAVMAMKFITTGLTGPTRFETITDSEAASAASTNSTNECQPKSTEPRWKKITAEPANRDQGARDRPRVQPLHPVRDGQEQRQQRADGQHDRRDPGRHLLHRPVQTAVRAREADQPVDHDQPEHTAAREPQPQRHDKHPEDERRETEPQAGAPERVELSVRIPDRNKIGAADDDGAHKRREANPVGGRRHLPTVQRRDR